MERPPEYDLATAERWLESKGWLRSVAGEHDFSLASRAVVELVRNPGRGLALIGNAGVGKTMLGDIVFSVVRGQRFRVNCWNASDVDFLVPREDKDLNGGIYNSGANDLLQKNIYLDDVGSERIVQSYGNTLDRVGEFIVRYHARGAGRLLMTTNLCGEDLERKYGARVLDRIFEMCTVVRFSGRSKRPRSIYT